MGLDRILIQHADGRRIPVEPAEIFYLEAEAHDTIVRLRSRRLLRDDRSMGQREKLLRDYYLLRVHRNFVVNLRRIAEIRSRKKGEGWELRMEPPVNRIIPVGETYEGALWKAFEV